MKRVDSFLLKAFIYGLPILISYAIFAYSYGWEASAQAGGYVKGLYDLGGFICGSWMLLAVYLSIRLLVSELFREKVLAKVTFIKERDEREVMFTGKAAKTTMLTSIAILIFLFVLSCFQVSVYQVPPEQAVDGKTRIVSFGVGFDLLNSSQQKQPKEIISRKNIISYTALPISGSTVILGLIIWQIISYNYLMRRLMKWGTHRDSESRSGNTL